MLLSNLNLLILVQLLRYECQKGRLLFGLQKEEHLVNLFEEFAKASVLLVVHHGLDVSYTV